MSGGVTPDPRPRGQIQSPVGDAPALPEEQVGASSRNFCVHSTTRAQVGPCADGKRQARGLPSAAAGNLAHLGAVDGCGSRLSWNDSIGQR